MERISSLERRYVLEALDYGFQTSFNNVFNARLEAAFAAKFRCKYAIGHVKGTATLHTALAALGVQPGDEVIVPPLTMSSPALAVLQNNSVPVFADVDPDTFNIDLRSVRKCITPKTRAIMSVSLYGLTPDYDELLKVCSEHDLYLIEDNAECFLGEYKGRLAGQIGHFASFSFQASKHMTCGEGGILTTSDVQLANCARQFSSLGYAGIDAKKGKISRDDIQDPRYNRHVALGFNYRLSEVNAAVALGQLERLDELVGARLTAARYFDEAIRGAECVRRQSEPEGQKNSYWAYSLVLKTKTPESAWYKFREIFRRNGGDGYYAAWKLSYMEPLFQEKIQKMAGVWQKYQPGLCPNAEYLQPRMIQLKTNYWNSAEAAAQAEALRKTVRQYEGPEGK